ncbi:MAG: hypothetical protein ACI93R_001708 [Flavobacteriales bacterium]|jgi:hypothetical protein
MTDTTHSALSQDPYVFNRAGILMSSDLVRNANPRLALQMRNITAGRSLNPQPEESSKHAELFRIELDSFQVREIVECLSAHAQTSNIDPGMSIVTKTLLEDWVSLAKKMIEELPESEKPNL